MSSEHLKKPPDLEMPPMSSAFYVESTDCCSGWSLLFQRERLLLDVCPFCGASHKTEKQSVEIMGG